MVSLFQVKREGNKITFCRSGQYAHRSADCAAVTGATEEVATVPAMSRNDIAGIARWVSSLAGTPGYDQVVESFVWSCDERAPEQSAAWIRGVADQNQQTRLYHRMLGNWASKDAAAVRT